MFTKKATIFTLIERNAWKFDTTVSDGLQTLCENLNSRAKVGSEI